MLYRVPLVVVSWVAAAFLLPMPGCTQSTSSAAPKAPVTLRSTLLEELHSTHDTAEWFTPINTAVAGLTPEQAKWTPTDAAGKLDPNANHSAGMLAFHMWYWNARALAKLRGQDPEKATGKYSGNNEETFNDFDSASWSKTVHDLDEVMKQIEDWTAHATDAQLAQWAPTLADICTHNAYHTGQILYVRKLQGVWDSNNGVK